MKKMLVILLIALVLIQFIRPARNYSGQANPADIGRVYPVPEKIQGILKNACYDCHSNHTHYPWYSDLQPVLWWMDSHIKEGKTALNFNEFGSYSSRRQQSKLKSIENSIEDGTMPITSYTIIHRSARLSKADKELVVSWINKIQDSLSKKQTIY